MEQIHKCGDPALIASDHSDARREGKQKTAVSYDPIVKYALILRLIVARRHWVGCVTNKLTAGRRQPARTLSTLRSPAHEIEASPQLAQREINSSNAATLSRRFSSPRIVSEVLGGRDRNFMSEDSCDNSRRAGSFVSSSAEEEFLRRA